MENPAGLYVAYPDPAFIRQSKDEASAVRRASLDAILDGIKARDIERLKAQLTPLLNRAPVYPADRHTTTRFMQEWQTRGLSVDVFNAVYDLLWEEQRAEREARSAPLRRYFERIHAEHFAVEPRTPRRRRFPFFGQPGAAS